MSKTNFKAAAKNNTFKYALILTVLLSVIFIISACPAIKPQVFTVTYTASEGGYIDGESSQTITYGENAIMVMAVPDTGYQFVRWSDTSSTDPTRTDLNIMADIAATAIFERISLTVKYTASEGGYIDGEGRQTITYGENAIMVMAVPYTGYQFVRWSDTSSTDPTRTDSNIMADIAATAIFNATSLMVTYTASEGGYIIGQAAQAVRYGEDTATVTAAADIGYRFAGWSDTGSTNPERTDINVKTDIDATAEFEEISKTFTYVYNSVQESNADKTIELKYNSLSKTTIPVPTKEYFIFDGWYLEPAFCTKIADKSGNLLMGLEIFEIAAEYIYAKWRAGGDLVYPILLVFVTEVEAVLEATDGTEVDVYCKLSELERKICQIIPYVLEDKLNEWFKGQIIFTVDTYFTTQKVETESFDSGDNSGKKTHYIFADRIPELYGKLWGYRSVITTFGMDDYDDILHSTGGLADTKHACVYLETLLKGLIINNEPIELLLDVSAHNYWNAILESYLHEFTHTVELGLRVYEFHAVIVYYGDKSIWGLEVIRLYLLNQAEVNKSLVGIPYKFWAGQMDVIVSYAASEGGTVNGKSSVVQAVPFGSSVEVTAIPKEGYRFVRWSDGVDAATRMDKNIIARINVTAIFEKI